MNFDPIGPLEDLELAFRHLGKDRQERVRFYVFCGAMLATALIVVSLRGFA